MCLGNYCATRGPIQYYVVRAFLCALMCPSWYLHCATSGPNHYVPETLDRSRARAVIVLQMCPGILILALRNRPTLHVFSSHKYIVLLSYSMAL